MLMGYFKLWGPIIFGGPVQLPTSPTLIDVPVSFLAFVSFRLKTYVVNFITILAGIVFHEFERNTQL